MLGQDLKERKDTINKIMGEILEDMTKASRDKIEKYSVPEEDMENEDETQTLEEAGYSSLKQPGRLTLCRALRTTRYLSTRDKNRNRRSFPS